MPVMTYIHTYIGEKGVADEERVAHVHIVHLDPCTLRVWQPCQISSYHPPEPVQSNLTKKVCALSHFRRLIPFIT